ncbi:sensor histidine kinase [Streptomyces sp. 4N509B]|uniref:sensor histidine kinase n=1 Tax=Streptomyces sp. 4N509B TaxID=3457413 RepID=UPI003FD0A418
MTRLYDFLRRHPTWVDGAWALVLLVITLFVITMPGEGAYEGPRGPATVVAAALSVVVLLRRRHPEWMMGLAFVTGVTQLLADIPPMPANFAFLVLVYTVATRTPRLPSRVALVGCLTAPAVATFRWPAESDEQDVVSTILSAVFLTVAFCLAWVLGDSIRTRRAYYAELEERANRLEREREREARMAVVAERARIARELHDVVAHNVSAMVVQADGAAYVLDSSPEQTRSALKTISGTGRQALTEMRRLLGVLRGEEGGTTGLDYVPQPGVEELADLVDQVRETGLPVDFRVEGTPRPLPRGVELTAYRIVQEALTNTRKHGGERAMATVRLSYGEADLVVLVEDDGRGARCELYERRGADGRGHGLIGMRERVGMVGGVLVAGPRPGGGFRIAATLPLPGGESGG